MLTMQREERRAYLRRLRPYIVSSVVLFTLGLAAGLIAVHSLPALADHFQNTLADFVKLFAGMSPFQLVGAIFLNNALKTFSAIVFGIFLGIIPMIFLLANGVALGVALSLSAQARGLGPSLLAIAPHGIIELPAVFLGTSIGLMIGHHSMLRLSGRSATPFGTEVLNGIRYFFTVLAPLLLLAALVEVFITGALAVPRQMIQAADELVLFQIHRPAIPLPA